MITSKFMLKEYIAADKSRNMVNCSRKYLLIEPFLSLFGAVRESFVVGNKGSQDNRAIIGNNVGLTIGCKVIGKVVLGNNVIVAPNSVVIKNIPDNAVVSGVPAKIIKVREV